MQVMSLVECEEYAQENGYNSLEFTAMFPNGPRSCKWLDADLGIFRIKGVNDDNTCSSRKDIQSAFPGLKCLVHESPIDPEDGE